MSRLQTLINASNGEVLGVNPKRLAEFPYMLLTNQPRNAVTVPAQQGSPPLTMSLSGEGPAEMLAIGRQNIIDGANVVDSAMRAFFQIQDGQTQRGLMNGAVHLNTISGQNGLPYRMPEALYMDELRSVIATFTNLNTTLANEVRPLIHGRRFVAQQVDVDLSRIRARMDRRQYLSSPYWYTLDGGPVTINAGATSQQAITVGQDHHFEIHTFSAVVQEAVGDGAGTFNWTINIIDMAKGESLIDAPQSTSRQIDGNLIFGTGTFPMKVDFPILVLRGVRLLLTITNNHINPLTFHLTLGGRALADRMWKQ